MKESDKKRTPNTNQPKRAARTERKPAKPQQKSNSKGPESKPKRDLPKLVTNTDPNAGSRVYEEHHDNVVADRELGVGTKGGSMVVTDNSSDLETRVKPGMDDGGDGDESDLNDSLSSQGDSSLVTEDEKVDKDSKSDVNVTNNKSADSGSCGFRVESGLDSGKSLSGVVEDADKKVSKLTTVPFSKENTDMRVATKPSLESSEGIDDKPIEHTSDASDNEMLDAKENGELEDEATLNQRIEEMEMRIEKLEEELREVAALEIALYSVVPEHGSSAHKVHTPARRLSRLYIHACKHWTQGKRGSIAKNTASGLVLIAKSCGNDVSRLTFWLSNTLVLREIISQTFGSSRHSTTVTRIAECNGSGKRNEGKSTSLKWKCSPGSKKVDGSLQFSDDWQETGTFLAALEKVESWIFSRMVESVWWQALTPHMQPPTRDLSSNRTSGRVLGPALGDQQQGTFSINLWRNAFQDAFQRLCPVRAGGHECGCLPVIARMVMEQCVSRLDVAMFNAILRESAHEIPTDPVSDPIVDSRVLPITAGNLSFGSGAQLKNAVGNWSRWLTDMFGINADDSLTEDQHISNGDDRRDSEPKSFNLLSDLSDLLMLPKDMLMDRSIRLEVCPSIILPLVKRILCNFTPDEFCPDHVPGAVLEALNAECIVERRLSADSAKSFPYTATQVVYNPPSSAAVAEKVAEAGTGSRLSRNASVVQRKGYTSDEELEELDCPLTSIIENLPLSPMITTNGSGNGKQERRGKAVTNARYGLLREVWSG